MVGMKMGYWGGYGRHDEQGWRKGPWTPDEDKLLTDYVKLHGDGRWSSVYKCTGLKRSGKSCRLRWVNYLRPGLKRGQLTPQEEGIIIELHSLWGNKWSTIASYLPGRTDNEIKNYWRTHFKKRTSPSSSSSSSPGKKRRSSATVVAAPTDDDDDRDNSQLQQQMVQVDHQVTEQEQNIPACDVNNQWPPPHGQYQLVPAAFGSGPIVEDWLWSGLWNFDDVVR